MANRLAGVTSAYLRQHAANPVDWHTWGDEAQARARAEDKPIFLSIGFATCHWCHVMARESFADEATAAILNDRFVAVKVDREERPDLDATYLEALRRLTGRAGWPATILLTPDLEPFFAGTYFPPEPRDGLPGLKRLLKSIDTAWRDQRERLVENARLVTHDLQAGQAAVAGVPDAQLVDRAAADLARLYDREHGGVGQQSKFPAPPLLGFLLERGRDGDAGALEQLHLSLRRMAYGGIRDAVGGGFHRYAVDRRWAVPHFEKSLADNALLADVYLRAWKVTGEPLYARVARETLDYLLAELRHEGGGFVSGQDAEVDGREGGFYVWTFSELAGVVGREAAVAFGATPEGNWDAVNVLRMPEHGDVAAWRERLRAVRAARTPPARDETVVAAWNGLATMALADAASALADDRYLAAAVEAAEFVLDRLAGDRRLMRSWHDGRTSVPAFLDDYAFMGLACLRLHQATLSPEWLDRALGLADEIERLFVDPEDSRLYLTGADVETALLRPVDAGGIASPSATSAAAELLWRVARVRGDHERERLALEGIRPLLRDAAERPEEHMHALTLVMLAGRPRRDVALIGDPSAAGTRELATVLWRGHVPEAVLAAAPGGGSRIPLLEGRGTIDGRPAAYVCEGMRCLQPATAAPLLERQLMGHPA